MDQAKEVEVVKALGELIERLKQCLFVQDIANKVWCFFS